MAALSAERSVPSTMADVSSFDYSDFVVSHQAELRAFARHHPVVVGGFGDTNCTSNYSRKLMAVMDSIRQSYLAWTWNTVQDYGGCSNAPVGRPRARDQRPAGRLLHRPPERLWRGRARSLPSTIRILRGGKHRGGAIRIPHGSLDDRGNGWRAAVGVVLSDHSLSESEHMPAWRHLMITVHYEPGGSVRTLACVDRAGAEDRWAPADQRSPL